MVPLSLPVPIVNCASCRCNRLTKIRAILRTEPGGAATERRAAHAKRPRTVWWCCAGGDTVAVWRKLSEGRVNESLCLIILRTLLAVSGADGQCRSRLRLPDLTQ